MELIVCSISFATGTSVLTHVFATYLTILTVLSCPVLCLSGGSCTESANSYPSQTLQVGCCCCHHAGCSRQSAETTNSDSHRSPQDDCQNHCLCKGGVLDHVAPPVDLLTIDVVATLNDSLLLTFAGVDSVPESAADPDSTSGLRARIALCSLQR